jgi:hypothetical protein
MSGLAGRFLRWLVHLVGGITLLRLLLLSLTLLSVGTGLIAVVAHIHSDWLQISIVFAILAGWLLARARLPGWGAGLAALAIGLAWLFLSVGKMSAPLDLFLPSLPPVLRQVLLRIPPEPGPLLNAWAMFARSLAGLADRLMLWLRNARTGRLAIDPGITSLVWGLALWLVSAWAAWWFRRREVPGVALLPATTLLAYTTYYTNSKNGLFWLVLTGGGWLLLQGLDSYLKARRRWEAQQMGQAEIEPGLAAATILLAAGLMLAGRYVPSVSIQSLSDTFQHIFQPQSEKNLAESLGLQQTPVVVIKTGSANMGLSAVHTVGAGPHLSQAVLMYVNVEGYIPPPSINVPSYINIARPEVSYYWRAQTYDIYNGHSWVASTAWTQKLAANDPYHPGLADLPDTDKLVVQHVQRLQPMDGAIFAAGDLLHTDQPSIAAWRAAGDLVDARTDANTFTVSSRLPFVTAAQLRRAGNQYPASLKNYLNLPDEVPERVRDLAALLTIHQPTPYDQVMAIQAYLRQFPYSLQVPAPPAGRDVADYFLFDLRKGYCDYFSTSMAVLVRLAGIPSRLVTGFSSGTYDYKTGRFVILQANAHSWVEVYFPGLGWVEFEPTSNLPPFPRPGETAASNTPPVNIPTPLPPQASAGAQINWSMLRPALAILGWVLACLVLLLLLWWLLPFESWLLNHQPAEKAILTIQSRLYRQGHAWGLAAEAARTPLEFARAFSGRLERFSGRARLAPILASLQSDFDWLAGLYARLLFSPHPPSSKEHHQAVRTWHRIRQSLRKLRYS